MNTTTASQSQDYVDKYYIEIAKLAALADSSVDRIVELVGKRCIPPHAYEVRSQKTFFSSFGKYELHDEAVYYFHPKHVEWIRQAEQFAKDNSLEQVARLVEEKFTEDILECLGSETMPWPAGIAHVWEYLMDGTWSLCLKEFNVPDLVTKELARKEIDLLTRGFSKTSFGTDEIVKLEKAIEAFNRVALPFSPHEVGESSRCLEVGKAVELLKRQTAAANQQSEQ